VAQKNCPASAEARRSLLDPEHEHISVRRQCELLGLPRSTVYYAPVPESNENLSLMKVIDAVYLENPSFGSRSIVAVLVNEGWEVNRKRLMRLMDIAGVAPKRNLSKPSPGHRVFPYLLRNMVVSRPDQVWSTEIVQSQMTKPAGLAGRTHGKRISHLDGRSRDDDAVHEQFGPLTLASEVSFVQTLADTF
jgi:hypothetical protein